MTPFVTPTGQTFHLQDHILHSAPLGLTFEDVAMRTRITDGLVVTATHEPSQVTTVAREGSTGIHGFVSLPTTRAAEAGPVDAFGDTDTYLIDVVDRRGRFLPLRTNEPAPAAFDADAPIFLYSAPTRPLLTSFAAIRASIQIDDTRIPAASGERRGRASHAKVVITGPGGTTEGFADAWGELLVLVPAGSPPPGAPIDAHTLSLSIEVFYDPDLVDKPTDPIPTWEQLDLQPARPHLAGPDLTDGGGFTAKPIETTVLTSASPSPSSRGSTLLLQPL